MSKVSSELQENNLEIPWRQVKAFRNIVAHNYFGVDAEEVWQIIQGYLPILEEQIRELFCG